MTFKKIALLIWAATAPVFLFAQQQMGAVATPQINSTFYVGTITGWYPTVQSAVTAACGVGKARVSIPAGATPSDTIASATGGCTTVGITDDRTTPSGCYAWSGSAYVACPGGIASLNGLSGAVTVAAGANTTVTNSGNTITIASTGGSGGGAVLPSSGIVYATSTSTGTEATAAQMAAALNGGPAPGAGQLPVGNSGGTAYAPITPSGDCSLTSAGDITCTKTNGLAFGTAATTNSTAYDAAGLAATAQASAEAYSSNASNLITGTVSASLIPILNQNTTGTAASLAATPTACSSGSAPAGIAANGNATGCTAYDAYGSAVAALTNAEAYSSNASNITSGTIATARVPTLNQNTTGQAGSVATINGLVAQGTNVTITGAGTTASPYVIASTGSGGGATLPSSGLVYAASTTTGTAATAAQVASALNGGMAPGAGQLPVGNAGGTAYSNVGVNGDCSLTSTGDITCTKTNGVLFGTMATQNASSYPTLAGPNIWGSGAQKFGGPIISSTSPVYDIRAYGASTASSDNQPAIQAAINAAIAAGGGTVYIPCGEWNLTSAYDSNDFSSLAIYNNGARVTLKLEETCAILQYTGSTPIHAVIESANTEPSGTWNGATWTASGWNISASIAYQYGVSIQNGFISGNANVLDGLDLIRPNDESFPNLNIYNVQNACIYVMSGVADTYDSSSCDPNYALGVGIPITITPLNGGVWDGYSGGNDASTTSPINRPSFGGGGSRAFTISSISRSNNVVTIGTTAATGLPVGSSFVLSGVADPTYNTSMRIATVSGDTITALQGGANSTSSGGMLGGVNLWFMDAGGMTVKSLQMSGGFQGFREDSLSGNVLDAPLFENCTAAAGVVLGGYANTLIGPTYNNCALEVSGRDNANLGMESNTSITIDSGAWGADFKDVYSLSSVTDNGPNTKWSLVGNLIAGSLTYNFPTEQEVLPSVSPAGTLDPTVVVKGLWMASDNSIALSTYNHFTPGKAWSAILNGTTLCNGTVETLPPNTTITDASPSIQVCGNNLTFGVSATAPYVFQETATVSAIGFDGEITFIPYSQTTAGGGPISVSAPSAYFGTLNAGTFGPIKSTTTIVSPSISTVALPVTGFNTGAALVGNMLYLPSSTGAANLTYSGSLIGGADANGMGGTYIRSNATHAPVAGQETWVNTLGVFEDQVVSLAPVVAPSAIIGGYPVCTSNGGPNCPAAASPLKTSLTDTVTVNTGTCSQLASIGLTGLTSSMTISQSLSAPLIQGWFLGSPTYSTSSGNPIVVVTLCNFSGTSGSSNSFTINLSAQ